MSLDRQIALAIVMAQHASDNGKGYYRLGRKPLSCHYAVQRFTANQGYNPKDSFIEKAVSLCQKGHNSFNYYIEAAPDQNGNDSFIIYFDTKIDSKRIQISFHSFNKRLWKKRVGQGRPTHWDHKIGGSYKSCIKLIKYYKL